MQLRRGLIAFALVFAAVAIGVSISAPPAEEEARGPSLPVPRSTAPTAVSLAFRHPVEDAPPVRAVRRGSHVLIRVQAQVPGDVELRGLGLVAPVTPGTPAVFDVLASRTGRYEVSLLSVAGERTRLGQLEVND